MNFNIPPATQALILVNVVVHFLILLVGSSVAGLINQLPLYPVGSGFAPWQLITYGFLHGGNFHLFVNMFVLFMFGGEIERLFGSRWFLIYYFVCLISAGLTQLVVAAFSGGFYGPTVGASGAVFGLLLAFGMYFPHRQVQLLIPPVAMPAWVAVTLFGVIELAFGVTGVMSNVAHFAHLGGMIGGFFMIMHRRGKWPRRRR